MRFFGIVQTAAHALGKVFFFWSHEGNDFVTDQLDGGDMSGWLVPMERAEEFDRIWKRSVDDLPDELADTFCIARWTADDGGAIGIEFK